MKTFANIIKGLCILLVFLAARTPAAGAEDAAAGGLELTVNDAVFTALKSNKSFQIQALGPKISKTGEERAKAAFDPALTSSLSTASSKSASGAKSRQTSAAAGLSETLKSGSQVTLDLSTSDSNSRPANGLYSSQFGITLRKPILRGAGSEVNLAGLHQAEIDTKSTYYQLQGYSESLIEQIVETYWNYALAERQIQIYEDSLKLAQQQLDETQAMIDVGKLAGVELVSAQAEAASRKQALININSRRDTLRIKLLHLINPSGAADFWNTDIAVKDQFVIPEMDLGDLETHIATALKMRPDLNSARLAADRGDLDVVKTKNGLLPYLSFFITLGKSEYADSFGQTIGGIFSGGSSAELGVNYSYNLEKRAEKASYEQSLLKREQTGIAIENMEMTVQEDMRGAWIEIHRASNQLDASRATLKLQEEKLRAEEEKYKVGRSTAINVASAQRDLLQSRVDEAQAIADYIVALEKFRLSEGSLLEYYGIKIL